MLASPCPDLLRLVGLMTPEQGTSTVDRVSIFGASLGSGLGVD
jgi:hypothetical protein